MDIPLSHADLARQFGRLEGRFDAIESKVDAQGTKLDRLLERDGERRGRDTAEERQAELDGAATNRRVAIGAAIGGGILVTAFQALGRKLGWLP